MPELPEVETIKNILQNQVCSYSVANVRFYRSSLRNPIPTKIIQESIVDQKIQCITRRAKYILIEFEQSNLLIHLGMSGKILLLDQEKPVMKHTHYVFSLKKNKKTTFLHYIDPRRFGVLDIFFNSPKNHKLLKDLGPEPLEHRNLAKFLKTMGETSRKPIKNFIMDNHNLVGVGNIYACESLALSRIDPARPSSKLNSQEWKTLSKNIKLVLKKAIRNGGTTLKDYRKADNEAGNHASQLAVYGRVNQKCNFCESNIKMIRLGGRSTYFCPNCQK